MSPDKQTTGNPAKPFTPSLSSHFRGAKSPLTPKLVGSAQSSPALSPRRDIHARAGPIGRDDPKLMSPLNNNITPRSGTRNSRIGTESPATPGAPKGTILARARALSIGEGSKNESAGTKQGAGLGISNTGTRPVTTASGPSPTYVATRTGAPIRAGSLERDISPQFFRANQAKPALDSNQPIPRPKLGPKASTFFYATGNKSSLTVQTEPARFNSLGHTKDDDRKFFRANDAPITTSQHTPARPLLSKKTSSASIRSNGNHSPDSQQQSRSRPRAPSPLKDSRAQGNQTLLTSPKRFLNKTTIPSPDVRQNLDRRKSIGSSLSAKFQPSHKKSASTTSSLPHIPPARKTSSPKPIIAFRSEPMVNHHPTGPGEISQTIQLAELSISPSSLSPRSTSLTSSNTFATSDTDRSDTFRLQSPFEMPKSPSTSTSSNFPLPPTSVPIPRSPPQPTQQQKQAELAASARRERKVLDLEISNSSLLAINKTLEREMRKQSAELRRFRRLSRSGRLSIATAGSLRATSGTSGLSTLAEDSENAPDAEVDESFDGFNDLDVSSSSEDDDLESTVSTSSSLNPGSASASLSPTSRKLRRRRRDEKRLLLDLSKHQQLLMDSQKLNQSIRLCLGWTEDMIREGGRALEYKVGIGDVKLGGRILRMEEEDDEHNEHSLTERWTEIDAKDTIVDIGILDMKSKMEEAVLWAGPGGIQSLDGSAGGAESPSLPPAE